MRLRANELPMKADGTVDETLDANLAFKVKVLVDGVLNNNVVEACEEGRWAILYTGEWDDEKDEPVTKIIHGTVKFIFDEADA